MVELKLKNIDFKNINISDIENMPNLFKDCYNLIELNLSNFDTSKATRMRFIFKSCSSLKTIKLPKDKSSREKLIKQLKKIKYIVK